MIIADRIVNIAKSYIGQNEIENNIGFKDPAFQKKITDMGWAKGHAWCSYFAELVWKEAYKDNPIIVHGLDRLFSASTIATFTNFRGNRLFNVTMKPVVGSVVIWRYGKSLQGHAGIVTAIINDFKFETIEGNTNNDGSREGNQVAMKIRKLAEPFSSRGLNLLGFINPIQV